MARGSVPQATLSSEINTATRSLHTELNKLITARVPFALPPLASDPKLYTTGLLHFAHIFLTFESLWNDLLPTNPPGAAASPPTSPLLSFLLVNPYAEPELFTSPPSPQTVAFLQRLRPKGLARSARIKKDLQYLSGLHPTDFDVMLAQYPGDKVADFCAHIRKSVGPKPHVLIAYAWCFYMAVFSGGRWIRGELGKAGPEFWSSGADAGTQDADAPLTEKGLSLWSFPGIHDGEDIKGEFKDRLLGAEALFTPDERVDVIEEAKTIFKLCAGLVHELDGALGTDLEQLKRMKAAPPHGNQMHGKPDKSEAVTSKESHQALRTWFQRPEVTSAAVALGCLACAGVLWLSY
ncbi:heme oxygenase-like protein [Paraphaeosphaeria sporulosa]|uniref:Heme oxygenase-like protein n=1 Tax=Paraphaeosphaeria sporulosa TaxID=1460663 RepID=A0A177CRS0_9PLEO|nr:heme oxygenase-like protein [Paraphaeosphaeria sporulosa]OAG09467.1 heme oxygenase-like protein [Paraphaeosphaeria sporulosa]